MKIFGLGIPELLIILAVALLIFGPKQLPKLGKALGKTVRGIREGIGNATEEAAVDEAPAEEPKRKKKAAAKKLPAAETETAQAAVAADEVEQPQAQ